MLRYLLVIVASLEFSVLGCGGKAADEPPVGKATSATSTPLENVARGLDDAMNRESALREKLKTDLSPVVNLATAKMKAAVAENLGSDAADKAKISADAKSVKSFGPDKWEVRGQFKGPDKNGVLIERNWTASIELAFGDLQCMSVKLDEPPSKPIKSPSF
jgi:hypothetical protein